MAHKKDPSYRLHKSSGQAVVTLPDGLGRRRDVLLGKFESPESWNEYYRVIAGCRLLAAQSNAGPAESISVNELILRYYTDAEQVFGPKKRGETSGTLANIADAVRPLKRLYGDTLAREFGPRSLKSLRQHLLDSDLCRNTINRRISRVNRCEDWRKGDQLRGRPPESAPSPPISLRLLCPSSPR